MTSKNIDMQTIFSKLSEKNKDIVILIAKSIEVAQKVTEQSYKFQSHAKQVQETNKKNIFNKISEINF